MFFIVVLVLVDIGIDVVVANLVRQRLRAFADTAADQPTRPAEPPRSVRSLIGWHRVCALAQIVTLAVLVYACLLNVSGFGADEPLPAGRALLIAAIVAAVLTLISVPAIVLIGKGLRHAARVEVGKTESGGRQTMSPWKGMVRAGGRAPVTGAIVGVIVIGANLLLTVPEPVRETIVAVYLVNIGLTIPYRRAFLHLDTWSWFGFPTSRVDDEVSER